MHPHRIETVGFMFDGEEVARHFLSEIGAFSLCEKCLAVNFISSPSHRQMVLGSSEVLAYEVSLFHRFT